MTSQARPHPTCIDVTGRLAIMRGEKEWLCSESCPPPGWELTMADAGRPIQSETRANLRRELNTLRQIAELIARRLAEIGKDLD